jgi:hypothetical protein
VDPTADPIQSLKDDHIADSDLESFSLTINVPN